MSRALRRLRIPVLLLGVAVVLSGHVGSPDTWFEGMAGPYRVQVVVRAPGVVPGLAQITIRTVDHRVTGVSVTPVVWNAAEGGAPPPDPGKPVPGAPGTWSAELWFMSPTTYNLRLVVVGDGGEGTAVIPVTAVATRILPMTRGFGLMLAGLGLFLGVGLLTILRAAARESVLAPGAAPTARDRRRGWIVAAIGAPALAGLVWGGSVWWQAEEEAYRRGLYQPLDTEARVDSGATGLVLALEVTDQTWKARNWTPLLPDHGKLMHLFAVAVEGDGFAHLHPVSADTTTFTTPLPGLPSGRYRLFADVVHESGFPRTFVAEVEWPETAGGVAGDSDDAWTSAAPADSVFTFPDGATLRWLRTGGPVVGEEAGLRFQVTDSSGAPVALDPYMSMRGHAMVAREDGGVFVHLHPSGTISAVAQQALTVRLPTDTVFGAVSRRLDSLTLPMSHPMEPVGELAFPWAFPEPGQYRVWVQARWGGEVRTAAFAVIVGDRR